MLPPYLKAYFWYKTVLSVNNTFQQKRGSKIWEKCRTLYTTRFGKIPTNNKVQQAMQNILNFYEDFSFLIEFPFVMELSFWLDLSSMVPSV